MADRWEFTLRPCGPGCEDTLALVGAASFLENFAGFLPGADVLAHCRKQHSAAKYAAWLAQPDTRACLAEVRDSPVGYALLCAPDLPVETKADDIELKRIYLLHRFHGSGAGAALMKWSIETARSIGKRRLLLGVHEGNEKALAFYRRHGFVNAGTRTFQVGQTICSDLILELML